MTTTKQIFDTGLIKEIDPTAQRRFLRGHLKADQIAFCNFYNDKHVNLLINTLGEYYFHKDASKFFHRVGLMDKSLFEYFKKMRERELKIISELFPIITEPLPDGRPHDLEAIRYAVFLRSNSLIELFEKQNQHLVKNCGFPGCGKVFWASRKDSHYCDDCRNKANVYESRKNNKKLLETRKCEYCLKEFTPKTKRARFCKDICRVRANNEKHI